MRYRGGADETIRSVLMTVNARLQPFDNEELLKIFTDNEIPLSEFGVDRDEDRKTKSNLFIVIPDDDDTFNFVPGMVYTAENAEPLNRKSDDGLYIDGYIMLPAHRTNRVRFLFDRFQYTVYLVLIPNGIIVCTVGLPAMGFFENMEKEQQEVQYETGKVVIMSSLWK